MPLQNKVDPFGVLHPVAMRGDFMGNRGCLHNAQRQVVRQRTSYKAWVTCLLQFKGVQRQLMSPGQYTELFFLDEATALAAGHRPCFYCRREDASRFADAWHKGHCCAEDQRVLVKDMDTALHRDRLLPDEARAVAFGDLPNGAMFSMQDDAAIAYLKHNAGVFRWTFDGYQKADFCPAECVIARTPICVLPVLHAGYTPQIHASLVP